MINLLPITEKQKIREGYHLLVLSVCLPTAAIILLLTLASFLPTFFLTISAYQKIFAESQSSEVITKKSQEMEMKKIVNETNTKISLLTDLVPDKSAQGFFREIIESRPLGVYITSYTYDNTSASSKRAGNSARIVIQGRAENRAALLSFVDTLNKKKSFSSVELPLSSLISGTNLSYSINITLAP